jgi:16S rRNA (guanine527-N7)-methyltransferase
MIGADVSRETLDRFAALLLVWNRTVNLISRRDEPRLWERHIADSLQLVPLLPTAATSAIDLGSGAGFPGLVLAIASGLQFHLVESDQRKAAFLREAVRVTRAPALVHATRIEMAKLAPAPLITARALAPLPRLLGLAAPLLGPGGQCLLMKGEDAATELTHARSKWQMQVDRFPSQTSPNACILRISHLRRVNPSD